MQPIEQRDSDAEAALNALGEAVLLVDLDRGTLPWCSTAASALLASLGCAADVVALSEHMPELHALLTGDASPSPQELRLQLDGRSFDVTLAPLPGAGRRVAVQLADAAERERAMQRHLEDRERLLFTSRVVSVGEMASTLAHELNQPIGAVTNLLRGVRMRMERDATASQEVQQAVERATEQALFASRIIARIREYTQSRQPRREHFDIAATARASAQLLDWEMQRDSVQLVLDLPQRPLTVRGDEVMLQQVFVNLIRNALDAMRGLPPAAPRVLTLKGERHGVQAEVMVGDTGCGLSDEAEAKLFVPFVSTKPSGMGIGLNICRSFIELHQGRLWFSRREPAGCAFHVAMPLDDTVPIHPDRGDSHEHTAHAVHRG